MAGITINVTNNLPGTTTTTMHWHGLHVPAKYDGGPHQIINNGATWSPSFRIMNDASTYWYHPHGANQTDLQVSKGIAGMIIVKDSTEASLILPRTYGIDDFPLIVQTKCFDILHQIAIATSYDTVPMVNGVIKPYLNAPAQVLRFRLLNGASERSFMFGFSNNMNFKLITTDGGLLDTPITLNRLRLSNGERAEILVDLSFYLNDTLFLMSYGSELQNGIMGSDSVGDTANQIPDYYSNFLNGADYNLLQLNVVAPTSSPITIIPTVLSSITPWSISSATVYRNFVLDTLSSGFVVPNEAEGPFGINRKTFDMDSINEKITLNSTEIWTIKNQTKVAHPFHVHDINFYILDVNGLPVPNYEKGKKDVVLVMPGDTVRIITKFEDYADSTTPYMYHCHILHHEDDGMMGSFIVIANNTSVKNLPLNNEVLIYPNPSTQVVNIEKNTSEDAVVTVYNSIGKIVYTNDFSKNLMINTSEWTKGFYTIALIERNGIIHKNLIIR